MPRPTIQQFSPLCLCALALLILQTLATGCGSNPGTAPQLAPDSQAPTITFTAERASIHAGTATMLHWNSEHATAFRIEPGIGAVALTGSLEIAPAATTTYTAIAQNATTETSALVTINVLQLPTVSLHADAASITSGSGTTLHWSSSGADSINISPEIGAVALSGSTQVVPSKTTTYVAVANSAGGSSTAAATVTVVEPPRGSSKRVYVNTYRACFGAFCEKHGSESLVEYEMESDTGSLKEIGRLPDLELLWNPISSGADLLFAGGGGGIQALKIDSKTGLLSESSLTTELSFGPAIPDPVRNRIYSASTDGIDSFSYDEQGSLSFGSHTPYPLDRDPIGFPLYSDFAGIAVEPKGRFLYAAFSGVGLFVSRIQEDGSVGSMSNASPTPLESFGGWYAWCFCMAFDKDGEYLLLASGVSLSAHKIDAETGQLTLIPNSTIAAPGSGFITLDSTDQFLYARTANQAGSQIVGYRFDRDNGGLTGLPDSPFDPSVYNFRLDPNGHFAIVTDGEQIWTDRINLLTGALERTDAVPTVPLGEVSNITVLDLPRK